MNTKLRTLLAFSTIALSAAALPAFGGDLDPMHVTVPFAFKAGKTNLPAGDYTVSEQDSGVVLIKGEHASAFVLGASTGEGEFGKASLSFDHNNSGYCLKTVHTWGKNTSTVFPVAAPSEK